MLNINEYPMGKSLRSYLNISDEDYRGEKTDRITPELKGDYIDHFIQYSKDKVVSDSEELVKLIDELVAMDLPILAIKLFELNKSFWNENDFQGQLAMGIAFMLNGELDDAVDFLSKAQELMPQEPATYVNIGQIYLHQGSYIEALEWIETGLEIEKNNFRLWQIYGECIFEKEPETFKDAIKIKADTLNSWAGLSMWLAQNPDFTASQKVDVLKKLYDSGETDPIFLSEYSAALGNALLYDQIPPIVWRLKGQNTSVPWQLYLHSAQANLAMEKLEQAKSDLKAARVAKGLPTQAIAEIEAMEKELETLKQEKSE